MIVPLLLAVSPALTPSVEDEPDLVVIDGKEIACRVLYEDEETVVYRARRKNKEVPAAEVGAIHSVERSLREFLEAYDRVSAADVTALADLALLCEGRDLAAEARNLWIRILTLDPENEEAWTKLGGSKGRKGWRMKVRGRFYTLEQLRERVADWKNAMELPTAHFLIKTDVAPERALDVAINLERAYLTYYDLLGPHLKLYVFDEIPEIHIFAHADDYPVPPTPREAWFSMAQNTLYVDGSKDDPNVGEIAANLTYALIYNSFHRTLGKSGSVAPWARRGLAEAFGAAIRREAEGRVRWDFEGPYLPHFGSHARDAQPLSMKQVIRAGYTAFDSGTDANRYVAQSYTLAYFLVHGQDGKHRAGFAEYLRSSFEGKGSTTHFEKILDVKLDDLEKEWAAYVKEIGR